MTEAGLAKVTEDMAVQLWKALLPIVVTVDGIVMVANLEQPLNADATMLLPDTIVSCVRLEQLKYPVEAKAAGTLRETSSTRKKASAPIEVTDDGTAKVTEDMAVQ